jgi:hypothetical protein
MEWWNGQASRRGRGTATLGGPQISGRPLGIPHGYVYYLKYIKDHRVTMTPSNRPSPTETSPRRRSHAGVTQRGGDPAQAAAYEAVDIRPGQKQRADRTGAQRGDVHLLELLPGPRPFFAGRSSRDVCRPFWGWHQTARGWRASSRSKPHPKFRRRGLAGWLQRFVLLSRPGGGLSHHTTMPETLTAPYAVHATCRRSRSSTRPRVRTVGDGRPPPT